MSQIYNGNTKRPKPKKNQQGILGILSREFMHYVRNSAEPPVQESMAGATYISLRIHPKSCRISLPKVAATLLSVQGKVQLEHSSHIVNVGIEATC